MIKAQIEKCFLKINFEKILIIYILLQPIIDVATSLCIRFINPHLTVGIFIRSLFLGFTLIYSLSVADKKWRKILFVYFFIVLLYLILFFANNLLNFGLILIVSQLKSIIKIFYFPILLIAFIPIMNKINFNKKYLIYSLFGYTSILAITALSGTGFNSYANGSGYGKNGLFYAANEIGTILCILMPFLLLSIININPIKSTKQKFLEILTLIFVIISSLWMGTKVPFLGLILSLLVSFGICIINIIKKINIKKYLYKSIIPLIILLIIFFTISYSPIGKNLGISINKIIKISESNNSKNDIKNNSLAQSNIETVVLSSRDIFFNNTLNDYKNSSIISKFIGIGYISNENGQFSQRKTIEIDYFDILFSNGIIGFLIFFAPLFALLLYVSILIWKKKRLLFENNIIFHLYSVFISLTVAGLSGHVLTAPAVSFYLALILNHLIIILKNKKENRKNAK